MNRRLCRSAGAVESTGGFRLLSATSAQADEAGDLNALLGEIFSPTSGLPALDLAATSPRPTPVDDLQLDPADGRHGVADNQSGVAAPKQLEPLPGLPEAEPPADPPAIPTIDPTDPLGLVGLGLAGKVAGGQLPPVIADQLASEWGGSPSLTDPLTAPLSILTGLPVNLDVGQLLPS